MDVGGGGMGGPGAKPGVSPWTPRRATQVVRCVLRHASSGGLGEASGRALGLGLAWNGEFEGGARFWIEI